MQWRTRSSQWPGCGWPDRAQTGAPPTPPLPRAATDNAGAYPRRPHHLPVLDDRRAASELHPQTRRTPSAGGHGIMTGIGRSGGTLSPGRLILLWWPPKAECAGPGTENAAPSGARPQGLRDRARHQPRSASHPLSARALRGGGARSGAPDTAARLQLRGRPSPHALHDPERWSGGAVVSREIARGVSRYNPDGASHSPKQEMARSETRRLVKCTRKGWMCEPGQARAETTLAPSSSCGSEGILLASKSLRQSQCKAIPTWKLSGNQVVRQ